MLPSAIFDPHIPAMLALGLTEEEANQAVDLFVTNFLGKDRCSVLHLCRQYFAVLESSEAMDWIWSNFPDFRCIVIHSHLVVDLESPSRATFFKLKWC